MFLFFFLKGQQVKHMDVNLFGQYYRILQYIAKLSIRIPLGAAALVVAEL